MFSFSQSSVSRCLIAVLMVLLFAVAAQGAITAGVSPASVAANSSGATIQTQAAAAGGSVQVELYYDANGNGVIDAGEWPLEKKLIKDNVTAAQDGPLGEGDIDPVDANISVSISFMGGVFHPGQFIVKVTNASAETASAILTITPVTVTTRTVTG